MSDVVILEHGELEVANLLAMLRQTNTSGAGVVEQKRAPDKSGFELNFLGVIAEIAFARLANIYPDMTTNPRAGGIDAILNGWRVDIKGTAKIDGDLMVKDTAKDRYYANPESPRVPNLYVMAVVTGNVVTFHGAITAAEVFSAHPLKNKGRGLNYYVTQSKLHPLSNYL